LKRVLIVLIVLGGILGAIFAGAAIFYVVSGSPPAHSNWVVPGASMAPAVQPGERIIADPRVTPTTGSIVLYAAPGTDRLLLGRVIATGDESVDLKDGKVFVGGKLLDDSRAVGRTSPITPSITYPVKVPEGGVWVLGDNRENSADSRLFGAVQLTSVKGVVTRVYWPLTSFRVIATH
jgi:signal peptidase I